MTPEVEFNGQTIMVSVGGLLAEINAKKICFAHLGCKVLYTIENVPPNLKTYWDTKFGSHKAWANKLDSKGRLARTLQKAIEQCGLSGLTLWDTMRTGSDYWRPGKLLTESVIRSLPLHFILTLFIV